MSGDGDRRVAGPPAGLTTAAARSWLAPGGSCWCRCMPWADAGGCGEAAGAMSCSGVARAEALAVSWWSAAVATGPRAVDGCARLRGSCGPGVTAAAAAAAAAAMRCLAAASAAGLIPRACTAAVASARTAACTSAMTRHMHMQSASPTVIRWPRWNAAPASKPHREPCLEAQCLTACTSARQGCVGAQGNWAHGGARRCVLQRVGYEKQRT